MPLLFWGSVVGACGTTNSAVDRGGECFYATDCTAGLVCVLQKNGKRICTDDLSGVVGDPPPGSDMGDAANADAPPGEGGMTDGPPPQDTGLDQNVEDTGQDTGQPPVDAGSDG